MRGGGGAAAMAAASDASMSSRQVVYRSASAAVVKIVNCSAPTASHTSAPTASGVDRGLQHLGREVRPRARVLGGHPREPRVLPQVGVHQPGAEHRDADAERSQRTGQCFGEPVGGKLRRDVGRGVPGVGPDARRSKRCSRRTRGRARPWAARTRARPAPGRARSPGGSAPTPTSPPGAGARAPRYRRCSSGGRRCRTGRTRPRPARRRRRRW